MKKISKKVIYGFILVLIILLGILFFKFSSEDSYIQDTNGIWIKHGNPSEIPQKVIDQQEALSLAQSLYNQQKKEGMQFSSQCLGVVNEYAVDIVHVPRTAEDNLQENQCEPYRTGQVSHFIELDKDGNLVRIV